jgi:hypothetical protein
MKTKTSKVAVLAIGLILLSALPAFALGPKMVDPHTAAWDPNTETDLAGYYVYYRPVTNPVTAWSDTRRSASVAPSPTPRYDLLQLIGQNGQYEIMVTAFDNAGNESGPSNIVPFVVDLPGAPKNTRVQSP